MTQTITPTHSYLARLVPANMLPEDVQPAADAGLLPTVRLRAPSASYATHSANMVTGLAVFSVERIEEPQALPLAA